jgi:hypothetical protein
MSYSLGCKYQRPPRALYPGHVTGARVPCPAVAIRALQPIFLHLHAQGGLEEQLLGVSMAGD